MELKMFRVFFSFTLTKSHDTTNNESKWECFKLRDQPKTNWKLLRSVFFVNIKIVRRRKIREWEERRKKIKQISGNEEVECLQHVQIRFTTEHEYTLKNNNEELL